MIKSHLNGFPIIAHIFLQFSFARLEETFMDKYSCTQTYIGGIDCINTTHQYKTKKVNDVNRKFKIRLFKCIKTVPIALLHNLIAILGTHFSVASGTLILYQG